jgi:hypothetical protein
VSVTPDCHHENAEHMMPGSASTPDWCVQVYAEVEQFRCIDCGAWLSLGPSVGPVPYVEVGLARELQEAGAFGALTERERRAVEWWASRDDIADAMVDAPWRRPHR